VDGAAGSGAVAQPGRRADSVIIKLALAGPKREFLDGVGAHERELTFFWNLAPSVPVGGPEAFTVVQDSVQMEHMPDIPISIYWSRECP
jgi:hypothetical protein